MEKFVQVGALSRVKVSRRAAAKARELGFPEALVGCATNPRAVAISKRAGVQEGGRAGGGQVGEVCGCAGGRADGWGAQSDHPGFGLQLQSQARLQGVEVGEKEARRFSSVLDVSNEEEVEVCLYINIRRCKRLGTLSCFSCRPTGSRSVRSSIYNCPISFRQTRPGQACGGRAFGG